MKNRQFDEMVRRQIMTEDITMHKLSENRILQAMQKPEVTQKARRLTFRTALVLILVLGLLCGAAIAAVSWNSREYLTYTDERGTPHVNEALLEYVQPMGQVFENDILRVDIIDAIFDGHALVLTWTTQNKTNEEIYLFCDMRVNGGFAGQGSRSNVDEIFLAPGEVVTSGMSSRTDEDMGVNGRDKQAADTMEVSMAFAAMLPQGEKVMIGALGGESGEDGYESYLAEIDRLNAEGKVVIAPDGVIELGSKYLAYEEGMTRAELYDASGALKTLGGLDVSFTVERNAEVKSALPDGKNVEVDNGDYILRVTKAELTPNAATFELERIFKNKEAAEKFAPYYAIPHGLYWGYNFVDEEGDIWWAGNSGGGSEQQEPELQPDGTYLWTYSATMTDLTRVPKFIQIIPTRDDENLDPEGPFKEGAHNIPYPDEGLTVYFD